MSGHVALVTRYDTSGSATRRLPAGAVWKMCQVERFSSSARLSHTSCLRECDRLKEMFDEAALTWENFRARVEESVVSPDLCQCLVIIQSAAFAHLKIDG